LADTGLRKQKIAVSDTPIPDVVHRFRKVGEDVCGALLQRHHLDG
jgi:hypothetical protein